MCSLLKAWNPLVNVALFPGAYVASTYTVESIRQHEDGDNARVLFIPIRNAGFIESTCFCVPSHIPAILVPNEDDAAQIFVIYFHGNGCDAGNVTVCGFYESKEFHAHYLIVEYPRYGMALGMPSEESVNIIAKSVLEFVEGALGVPHDRIVIMGRSIGTGPACFLASHMESLNKQPAALVLHSPYSSIRNAGAELVGPIIWGVLDRWENWRALCAHSTDSIKPDTATTNPNNRGNNSGQQLASPRTKNGYSNANSNSSSNGNSTGNNRINAAGTEDEYMYDDEDEPATTAGNTGANSSSAKLTNNGVTVVTVPVIFLHADNDVIIDCSHSQQMHAARLNSGLPSAFFLQRSTPVQIKGHNFYDYDNDYLYPVRLFLQRCGAIASAPHPGRAQHASSSVPRKPIQLPAHVVDAVAAVADTYNPDKNTTTRYLNRGVMALSWLMCPAVLCAECAVGCTVSACLCGEVCLNGPDSVHTFEYDASPETSGRRPRGFTDNFLVKALVSIARTRSVEFQFENEESLKQKSSVTKSHKGPYASVDTDNPMHHMAMNSQKSTKSTGTDSTAPTSPTLSSASSRSISTQRTRTFYPNEIIIEPKPPRPRGKRRIRLLDVKTGDNQHVAEPEQINPLVSMEMQRIDVIDMKTAHNEAEQPRSGGAGGVGDAGGTGGGANEEYESGDSDDDSVYQAGSGTSSPRHDANSPIARTRSNKGLDYVPG
jgi:hypothetical protein